MNKITCKLLAPRLAVLIVFNLAAVPGTALAQLQTPELSQMSIEDLMSIEITSASRKEQRALDVAAAVFVITQSDIRQSGMTTIPDVLRMAPGINVAQINANKWAVSVRGFNGLYANKLLVLVDGRSIYNRLFSGVTWEAEDPLLDDVDRIEVIRGPGAALWGANAVNGVINIVTKAAADTHGGFVRVDGGGTGAQGAARYGGVKGGAHYRVYAQWTRRDESLVTANVGANDRSRSVTTGFRADWTKKAGAFTLEADVTAGRNRSLWPNLNPATSVLEPIVNDPSDLRSGQVLGRWTRTSAGGASLQMQSFVDVGSRQEPVGNYDRQVVDFDTQYHTAVGAHQDLVAGGGYRYSRDTFIGNVPYSITPAAGRSSLLTAFIQHEIVTVGNRLAITLGSQIQHESISGIGLQPSARVMWKGLSHQRLWLASSRAIRTPSLYERGIRVDLLPVPSAGGLPIFVTAIGNPAILTEHFVDTEAGYRLEIGSGAAVDVTGFIGRYDHLRTVETTDPLVTFDPSPRILITSQFENQLRATTRGLEVAGYWKPIPAWRLDGNYTLFDVTPHLAASSRDTDGALEDGSAPRTQWQIWSTHAIGTRATVNVAIFYVGPLARFHVAGYTRADVSAEWRFTHRVSLMAIGQNLLDSAHAEFGAGSGSFVLETQVPRTADLRLKWSF